MARQGEGTNGATSETSKVRPGVARPGRVRRGEARSGEAGRGLAWLGKAREPMAQADCVHYGR